MRKDTRVVILANGLNGNWGNRKTPRHYVKIGGERMIDRTVRLLKKAQIEDIIILSPNYRIKGVTNVHVHSNYYNHEADKFIASTPQWNRLGTTILLDADTYFTEDGLKQVLRYRGASFKVFCRPSKSKFTEKEWGECFAVYLQPSAHQRAANKLSNLVSLFNEDKLWSTNAFAWARLMMGIDPKHINNHLYQAPVYSVIDDLTECITSPSDYSNLVAAIKKKRV